MKNGSRTVGGGDGGRDSDELIVVRKMSKPNLMFSPAIGSAPICSMIQLSDGRTLVTGSLDGLVRSWKINESLSSSSSSIYSTYSSSSASASDLYVEQMRFVGHEKRVSCLAEVDEDTFVSGSWDGDIKRWRLSDGECLATLGGSVYGVYCLVSLRMFGRKVLVSGSGNHKIHLWNLHTNSCVMTLPGHGFAVRSMTELDSDGLIATCAFDAKIKVWRVTAWPPAVKSRSSLATVSARSTTYTIECYHKIADESGGKLSVVQALKKSLVACGSSDGDLKIWNVNPEDIPTKPRLKARERHLAALVARAKHGRSISSIARLSHHEPVDAFVTGSEDGSVRGWNFKAECLFEGRTKLPIHTALCPLRDSLLAASTISSGETVLLWRIPFRYHLSTNYQSSIIYILCLGSVNQNKASSSSDQNRC